MLVAIRDDDICYFTKPEQLQFVYGQYWDTYPVTLSVIPFVDGRNKTKLTLVPPQILGTPKQYPVGQNEKLLTYLKEQLENKHIGISMHGYCHLTENGIPEFESDQDFSKKVLDGKRHLEEAFGVEIKVFTPPNNSMSRKGAKAVIDAGMNVVMAYGFYPWERPINYKTFMSFLTLCMHHLKYKRAYPYPKALDCGTHKEHACVVLHEKTTLEHLKQQFEFLRNKNANMCIAVHYVGLYHLSALRKVFNGFMDYLLSNHKQDIQFVTADKLFEAQ